MPALIANPTLGRESEGKADAAITLRVEEQADAQKPLGTGSEFSAGTTAAMGMRIETQSRLEPRQAPDTPNTKHLSTRISRKKKKRAGMKPGAPAQTVTRGFETPTASSEAEDSDFSSAAVTPRLGPVGSSASRYNASPMIRPSALTRVISNLKLEEVGSGDLGSEQDKNGHNESLGSTTTDLASVEVLIEEPTKVKDFAADGDRKASSLCRAMEGGLRHDSPHRKMTAADFEPLKCLGKGAFGTVVLVKQHSTGRLFAQKQLKKASITARKRLIEQTKTERLILESVKRHPFVVKLFYAFQDHRKLYLILEYAQGGELFRHLQIERSLTEETAAFYMAEMVLALEHLHNNLGVVYRDLKPENCLLDSEGHLLLTDFGLSKATLDDEESPTRLATGSGTPRCNSILGTVEYMAPEIIQGRSYDAAVDWWSLGALGFDLLTGAPPFTGNNDTKIQQKIVHSKLALPYYLSPDAKDLLTRLLRKEPRKRLGANMPADLATIKKHRFFRRIDWVALENRELTAPIQPIITDPAEAENFATEFTDLIVSPTETSKLMGREIGSARKTPEQRLSRADGSMAPPTDDPFGGFSYVASRSLLENEGLGYFTRAGNEL